MLAEGRVQGVLRGRPGESLPLVLLADGYAILMGHTLLG